MLLELETEPAVHLYTAIYVGIFCMPNYAQNICLTRASQEYKIYTKNGLTYFYIFYILLQTLNYIYKQSLAVMIGDG